jgi:hypothetical protein
MNEEKIRELKVDEPNSLLSAVTRDEFARDFIFILSPLCAERSSEPTGPTRSGRPDDKLRGRGCGGLPASLNLAATPLIPTFSPLAGRRLSPRNAK